MGYVINESREECGDPRSWRATEACHQLVAPNGEITRCCGELLLIGLNAGAKERGGGATSPTCGNAATNLACGVSGVAGSGGGHDAECYPINATSLGRDLRSGNGAIKGANLLDCRNCCSWPAPRFKECCHILVVGDRQKELAHAPEGIWRIGERIATDSLNARANLSAPLCRKRGCDGGNGAEICSKLQGACGARSGEDPFDLCANPFAREACSQRGITLDCCGGTWLHRQIEACNKSNRAQHAQRIFNKSFGRITNRTQQTVGQILSAAMGINDRPVGDWIGAATRLRGETERDRVDGEVSTSEVTIDTREEGDLVGATGVAATTIGTEGGDLTNHSVASGNADGAEPILVGGARKECT
jgi:hypothetical protein